MPNMFSTPASRLVAQRGHTLPHKPHKSPSEEGDEDEEDLELPVNPDEGTPLIPDEEGNVEVPG